MEHLRLGLKLDNRTPRRVSWDRQAGSLPELWHPWYRPLVPVAANRVVTFTGAPHDTYDEHSLDDVRDPR